MDSKTIHDMIYCKFLLVLRATNDHIYNLFTYPCEKMATGLDHGKYVWMCVLPYLPFGKFTRKWTRWIERICGGVLPLLQCFFADMASEGLKFAWNKKLVTWHSEFCGLQMLPTPGNVQFFWTLWCHQTTSLLEYVENNLLQWNDVPYGGWVLLRCSIWFKCKVRTMFQGCGKEHSKHIMYLLCVMWFSLDFLVLAKFWDNSII